jgi:hypothetical protein
MSNDLLFQGIGQFAFKFDTVGFLHHATLILPYG